MDGAVGHKRDRLYTGRPTGSTDLDPWGSQSLNHQPKNLQGLDLDPLPAPNHMQQMCNMVFMWVLNNLDGGYPKSCCLYVGYVLLAELPCLASVGEKVPSLTET